MNPRHFCASLALIFALIANGLVRADDNPAPTQLSPASRAVSLNGTWQLSYGPIKNIDVLQQDLRQPPLDNKIISATVPGNVELDLLAAGAIPDPMIGDKVWQLLPFETYQWWYKRSFAGPTLNPGEKAELVFDGIDCCAAVWVNGQLVGRPANMMVPHRFDVTALLRPDGNNDVQVRIDPAMLVGRQKATPGEFAYPVLWEQLNIRKPAVMYGWDITPRILSAGLWKDVRLEITQPTHLNEIYWATRSIDRQKKTASLMFDWDFSTDRLDLDTHPYKVRATLSRNGKTAYENVLSALDTHGQETFEVKDVDFWWPRGSGDPALYDATVDLLDENDKVLDERKERIGIRTITLHRVDMNRPADPGDYCFIVNGERIFVKGVNFGSLDCLHSRDAGRVDDMFRPLADLNVNFIRLYGASIYPPTHLYDLCDESGIMVWQEFVMGNQRAPQTDAFKKIMDDEASAIIPQYRNHASLAIWCGGNEFDGDWFIRDGIDPNTYDGISRGVLPVAVKRLDPQRDYVPCCWYLDPVAAQRGVPVDKWVSDTHRYLWDAPYYFKAPFYTTRLDEHFVSEIGWKGCPTRASLEQMFEPDSLKPDPWIDGDVNKWKTPWLVKATQALPTQPLGLERMNLLNHQIMTVFDDVPKNLDDYIVASQVAQAEATKFFFDSLRMRKSVVPGNDTINGVVLFQYQDAWPIVNFSIVDYYGRKKLAYDYLQECLRNVQVICGEAKDGKHPVVIVNDTLAPAKGHVTITKLGAKAALYSGDFTVPANGIATLGSIHHPKETEMWQIAWKLQDGQEFKCHYLATDKVVTLAQYEDWMKQLGIRMP